MFNFDDLFKDLPKSVIFCSEADKYNIKKEFENYSDYVKVATFKKEFLKIDSYKENTIEKALQHTDICFIVAALDEENDFKITESIYEVAKKKHIITIGIGVKPSILENEEERKFSDSKISWFKNNLDSLIVIDNEFLIDNDSKDSELNHILKLSRGAVEETIKCIVDLISVPGLINLDLDDLKMVMKGNTMAYTACGQATGDNRAEVATKQAINSPFLLEPLSKATSILFKIEGASDMSLIEINNAAEEIQRAANPDVNIVFGAVINEDLKDALKISVIASGYKCKKHLTVIK